ncbi:hypothetical protein HO173_004701 [Letharia columbiana]|uniref:Uncharacterized protein n=1 Tax=Letharia columbiana TaxID=112416 RepID=A0A8H6FYQ6_9LECA|nr:uncharacterized protein HO173_004701 [Letharia columbiana]KAF6237233.1 hypothetical protein HO173_004701 [Letharia columbiana]
MAWPNTAEKREMKDSALEERANEHVPFPGKKAVRKRKMAAGSPNAEPEAGHAARKTPYLVPCVKLLCGNHGVMVDEFISLYIGEEGISEIIEPVFEVTDPVFRELLALGQSERAEAAKRILQPLDVFSSDMMASMRVLNVPAGAAFWEEFPSYVSQRYSR